MANLYIQQQKALSQQIKKHLSTGQSNSTFVEMRQDYENDSETCLTSVVFVPENLAQIILERVIKPLKAVEPEHFYYSSDLMHLTIKNVRTIHTPPLFTDLEVTKANQVFEKIVPQFQAFTFTVEDVMLFPTSVSLMGYSNQTLQELVPALDAGLNEAGVPDNKSYFSDTVFFGNLTVCRLTHSPSLEFRQRVKELETTHIGEMKVKELHLITCNSVCHPKTRKIIGTYQLSGS